MENIINIFEKFGWWGVLGIFVSLLLFIGAKWIAKKLSQDVESGLEKVGTKLTEQMSKQNDTLTKVIVDQQERLFEHLLSEKKTEQSRHTNMINDKEDLAVDINNYLKDIMHIHNSQRAYILEFHNHNENLSGTPFVKFTCKYEWFEQGYDPLINTVKDMAFASLAQIVKEVRHSESQCVIYTDMGKFSKSNPSIAYYIKGEESKSFIFKGLYDKNNILIALLVLEYNYVINPTNVKYNKLLVEGAELTQMINLRYKYEK